MRLEALQRPALVAELGGFRPPGDPFASWMGRVRVALPGEGWPTEDGEPMLALAQINLSEVDPVPDSLKGLALITLFIGPRQLPIAEPNGQKWCLRSYPTLERLIPLEEPEPARAGDPKARKGEKPTYGQFPIRWRAATDMPSHDEVPPELLDEYEGWREALDDDEAVVTHLGLKLGGWPYCVQHEVQWPAPDVEFAIQVDSEERIGFAIGYGGIAYIGRRRTAGGDEWHLTWQSM
jgi:hypothetical protein